MLIPAKMLSAGPLSSVEAGCLFLAVENRGELFWVVESSAEKFAIFLTGDFAGHAIPAVAGDNWSGISLGPVTLRADPASANRGDGRLDWQLRFDNGALQVRGLVKDEGSFTNHVWFSVEAVNSPPQGRIFLSRWSLGIEVDERWCELFRAHDGKVSMLFNPAAQPLS